MAVKFCSVIAPDFDKLEYYIRKALQNGKMSNFGILYEELSNKIHEYLHLPKNKEVVLVSSGHVALMAAYACANTQYGTLAIPAYTFESTRCAATTQGIPVHLVDVDEHGTPDLDKLDPSKFDTLVVVTALSAIPDMYQYQTYCDSANKKLIVDGAASFGSIWYVSEEEESYFETPYAFGDAYCLSFHSTKSFPIGEAGAVICSPELAAKIRSYVNFGFDERHIPTIRGLNGKISEYSCAVGLALFDKVERLIEVRKRNASYFKKEIKKFGGKVKTLGSFFAEDTVYQSFPIFMDRSEEVIRAFSEAGIDTLKYYRPLSMNKDLFPVANRLYERNICLPIHHMVTFNTIDRMVEIISNFV